MSKQAKSDLRPDMNVTPLVDVVLVLLIIFMVIAPQMESGAAVDLPGILNPDGENKTKLEPILVSITANGDTWLDKQPIARDALLERLQALHEKDTHRKLLLKTDRAARYGAVRELFVQVQEVGFPGVSLQVGDRKQEGEG